MARKTIAVVLATTAVVLGTAGSALACPPHAHPAYSSADFEAATTPDADALTYDQKLVPLDSHATVLSLPSRDGKKTKISLRVHDLLPNHQYGAHAHQKACGASGDVAGPHYQNVPDPVQPSVDPKYANPQNEVWLDFTTDEHGYAQSSTTVDWQFVDRHAGAVVIHAEHTHTDPGHAGMAGARLACIKVDF